MKLLTKIETEKKISFEKKSEIEEGAKLAKKIDELRSTYARESVNLKKFHEEQTKRLTDDITHLLGEKKTLENEIIRLKTSIIKINETIQLIKNLA